MATPIKKGDNSKGQRKAAVAKKADPGSRGRKTTPIKGSKNARVTPKVVESGVGNVPMTVAKAAVAAGKALKGKTPKAKADAKKQEQQKLWREVEKEMRATKAKAEKELAAIAKKRAAVEKMGAEAPKRRGEAVKKAKHAQDYGPRKQTSIRMQDHNGNWGWR